MSGPSYHGRTHDPEGSDPASVGIWRYVGDAAAWAIGSLYEPEQRAAHGVYIYIAIAASLAIEPGATTNWQSYWRIDGSTFQHGHNAGSSTPIPNPVPLRYRIATGNLNLIDTDGVTIIQYNDKLVDIEGDVLGMADGDVVFTFPPAWWPEYDVPVHAHDDDRNYVAGRVFAATGNFVLGVA